MRFSWIPPMFTATKGSSERGESECISLATTSLPDPLSPLTRTVVSLRAILSMALLSARAASLSPMNREGTAAVRAPASIRSSRRMLETAARILWMSSSGSKGLMR